MNLEQKANKNKNKKQTDPQRAMLCYHLTEEPQRGGEHTRVLLQTSLMLVRLIIRF